MGLGVTLHRALNGRRKHSSDVLRSDLVYLKDFWRVDHPEIQKEGDVYHRLHEARVPNIAKLGRAGDVRLTIDDGQIRNPVCVQRTRTQDYLNRSWCPGRPVVEPYIHYRLVLETVGMPLNRFKSTRQLCEVIRDAIIGAESFPYITPQIDSSNSSQHCVQQDSNLTSGHQRRKYPHHRGGCWSFDRLGLVEDGERRCRCKAQATLTDGEYSQ